MGQRSHLADSELVVKVFRYLAILWLAVLLAGCKPPLGSPPQAPAPDSERQRLVAHLLAKIPPGASISIQPELITYLGTTGSPYFFPVVGDAEYVLADVTTSQDPLVMKGIYQKTLELLDGGQFGVVEARDGLILLRRGLAGQSQIPDDFYDFLRVRQGEAFPLGARFGDALELAAYDYKTSGGDLVRLVTYWRAIRPLETDYSLVFLVEPMAGPSPDAYEDASLTSLWYPPSRWRSGEVIKVETTVASKGSRLAQIAVYEQSKQGGRVALPASLSKGPSLDGAVRILDLNQPPTEKVSLASLVGVPFDPTPTPVQNAKMKTQAVSLCGKPLEDPSLARLRPVAVKIDNAPGGRPQTGLDQACVVYEHLAEGGITRFTAIYQTEETEVGPVRSARRVDLHIVPQYQAFFAHVGGAPAEMAYIKMYKLLDVDQFFHSEAYYYVRQRSAPYNVYSSVSRIRDMGEALGYGREAKLEGFPLGDTPQGGNPATDILIPYPPPSRAEFRYDPETGDYVRFTDGRPHLDAPSGQAVRTKNIIVQRVPSWIVSYTEDAGGAPSLDFDLVGEGQATVFRDGLAFEGKWVRSSLEGWTRFYDEAGQPIPLAPGKIWISLVSPEDKVEVH
ncbi:MAG: DUF3048 domain-containing protein [Dehalococcoidia bacterium]|nr:DUF3048 domain-containing protein [Dehalococcoidia bacterium]